jgi:hypothetical protein
MGGQWQALVNTVPSVSMNGGEFCSSYSRCTFIHCVSCVELQQCFKKLLRCRVFIGLHSFPLPESKHHAKRREGE